MPRLRKGANGRHFVVATAVFACVVAWMGIASATTLDDFIKLSQSSSPYGRGMHYADEWCHFALSDRSLNWWYHRDPLSDTLVATRVRNAHSVAFSYTGYGGPRFGSLLFAYDVIGDTGRGGAPANNLSNTGTEQSNRSRSGPDCDLGDYIVSQSPFPIVEIPPSKSNGSAPTIDYVTLVDPAPEYRWWYFQSRPYSVRFVLTIPVSYNVNGAKVPGHILVGFSGTL